MLVSYTGDTLATIATTRGFVPNIQVQGPTGIVVRSLANGGWANMINPTVTPSLTTNIQTATGMPNTQYYTGSNIDGTVSPAGNCLDWTTASPVQNGRRGTRNVLTNAWISGATVTCNTALRALCACVN
jgi:hypothetical protein